MELLQNIKAAILPGPKRIKRVIQTWLFLIPRYFDFKIISLGFVLQLFIIDYFELSLFRIIFRFP